MDRVDGPYAVVIVPTRELVLQGFETFNKLCAGCTWIVPGQLMGGEKKKSEKARLRKGACVLNVARIRFANLRYIYLSPSDLSTARESSASAKSF